MKRKPFEDLINRGNVKNRVIKEGWIINECALCGQQPEWQGKKLVMVLDHINGKNKDNRLENLRLLCPNCNSQTETFSGRNVKRTIPDSSNGKTIASDAMDQGSIP